MEECLNSLELPSDFITECKPVIGDEWNDFVSALSSPASVSVRFNDRKFNDLAILGDDFILDSKVPWCNFGRYLKVRPQFTMDPLFHAGVYYVQEASSMFIMQALTQYVDRSAVVLDMCAAPGGKSTLISSFINEDGMLVSNEFVSQRAHILTENVIKWGAPNCIVTNNAPSHFEKLKHFFDVVAVDAPCSGEGMFRKDANAVSEWSLANVQKCVVRQRDILKSAWEALKPGGVLIYSTCTYNRNENEEQVKWLLDEFDAVYLPLNVDASWNITQSDLGYRFFPHKTRGEGLFLSVLRKPDGACAKNKFKLPKQLPEKKDNLLNWIVEGEKYVSLFYKGVFYAVQKTRYSFVLQIMNSLNVLTFGIPLAEVKGKSEIPNVGLALSVAYDMFSMPIVDVTYEQAISFLRTEALVLDNVPRGYVLVRYKGFSLGWVKNVGNRCNNLYPEHWRIRMQSK